MKKKLYGALKVLLVLVLAGGVLMTARKNMDYRKGEQSYAQAAQTVGIDQWPVKEKNLQKNQGADHMEEDPYAAVLADIDLEALQEINSDVLGWIAIPETAVSYPIVQTGDNSFYLNHTWEKNRGAVGAIFLEQYNSPYFDDFNTLIYGHKMRDGSMFGSLQSYENTEYWENHPSVYVADGRGVYRYDIFAAYEVGVREIVYRLDLEDQQQKQEFIQFGLEHSVIDTGIVPEDKEQIVTLSTCTGRGHATRWIIQGVRRGEMWFEGAS